VEGVSGGSERVPAADSIGEAEFAELLAGRSGRFFTEVSGICDGGATTASRARFSNLVHECHEMESFLDDHGARLNRRFVVLTELVASVRSFAITGYAAAHLKGRLQSYGHSDWGEAGGAAVQAIESLLRLVQGAVDSLFPRLVEEATSCGFQPIIDVDESRRKPLVEAKRRLPHDIGEDQSVDDPQRVAELVARYLQAVEMLEELGVDAIADDVDRSRYVDQHCREEQARVYEATVHNLQSTYDTYIKNTVLETEDVRLRSLRGRASAALHLLEAVTQLAHFHERHEGDHGLAPTAPMLSALVPRARVQEVMVNDLLVAAVQVLRDGKETAEALLGDFTRVRELVVELPEGVTLHARPVALIVGIVSHFGTPVEVEIGQRRCNAGSILEVLMAIGGAEDVSEFIFRGDERPLRHIALLFESGLGESEGTEMPLELSYLAIK
jgi:phosphotransferase system HPr-like phosphotransfer protein